MFKLSDLAALSKEVSKITEHENFDLKYVEEGLDVENIDNVEEAFVTPGMRKYKAAKALISRLKAKDKSGQKLSPEDYKKLQGALTYVSQTDRAGAMKKSGGKTDGVTKVKEDVELEEQKLKDSEKPLWYKGLMDSAKKRMDDPKLSAQEKALAKASYERAKYKLDNLKSK